MSREKSCVYVYKGLHFRNTVYGLLSHRFIFRAHTCRKSSIRPQRWIYVNINMYLWIDFYMPQLLPLVPTTTTLLLFLFPPTLLSLPKVLLENSDWFSPPRVSDHKWRAASDGQVGWATESNAISITTYFPRRWILANTWWRKGNNKKKQTQQTLISSTSAGTLMRLWPHTCCTFVSLTVALTFHSIFLQYIGNPSCFLWVKMKFVCFFSSSSSSCYGHETI